jgi:probable addiction module antidote protein
MTETFYPFDFAEPLDDAETIRFFLRDAVETEDIAYIAAALGVVAKSKGLVDLAKKTSYSRNQISKAFASPDSVKSNTTRSVLNAIGIELPELHK